VKRAAAVSKMRPRTHQTAEKHRERADKHQAGIEALPIHALLVVPESVKAPEIRHAKRDHAAGQRDNSRAENHAENPQQWLGRNLRRQPLRLLRARYLSEMGELLRSKLPYFSGYRLVRTVAITESPGRSLAAKALSSSAILTGMRCTTLVKLPVALSGGSREIVTRWLARSPAPSHELPARDIGQCEVRQRHRYLRWSTGFHDSSPAPTS